MAMAANAVDKFVFRTIFLAPFAEAVVLVQTGGADVNSFAVAVDNVESLAATFLALLTEFVFVRVATGTVEPFGSFVAAGNAQTISANLKRLEVVGMVGANGNLGIEIAMTPIAITAEALALAKIDAVFVVAIFLGLPEVRNAFKLRQFTLNQIAIKFRLSLIAASSAVGIVEPTLEQEPVVRFIGENLA